MVELKIGDVLMTEKGVSVKIDSVLGEGGQGKIYKVTYNGKEYKVAVTVGSNGYIVGANPRS